MLPLDVLNEPLFFNKQICQPAASSATTNTACPAAAFLTPQQKPLMLSAGITKVAHLPLSLQLQQPQLLASELYSVLLALPPAWRTIACQLNPNIHLVSNSFGLRHTTHLRCSDRPAPHDWRPSATSADPTRACLLSQPCPSHLLGPL